MDRRALVCVLTCRICLYHCYKRLISLHCQITVVICSLNLIVKELIDHIDGLDLFLWVHLSRWLFHVPPSCGGWENRCCSSLFLLLLFLIQAIDFSVSMLIKIDIKFFGRRRTLAFFEVDWTLCFVYETLVAFFEGGVIVLSLDHGQLRLLLVGWVCCRLLSLG